MEEYKIELLPAAWDDLQEIFDYIFWDSPKAADYVLENIMSSLRTLGTFPNLGKVAPDNELKKYGFRMVVASPYISFYRFVNNTVIVYHITHASRNYGDLLKRYLEK